MARRSSSAIDLTMLDDSEATDFDGVTAAPFEQPDEPRRKESKPLSREASVRALGRTYQGVHSIGATLLQEPDIAISDAEAREFGKATYDLLLAYGRSLAANPKAAAWIAWIITVLEIDGPRLAHLMTRPPVERRNEAEDGPVPDLIIPQAGDWAAYQP